MLAEQQAQKIALKIERGFISLTNKMLKRIDYNRPLDAESLQILNDYSIALQNTPYAEVFDDFLELYGERAQQVRARLGSIANRELIYTGADVYTMDAMINTDFELVSKTIETMGTTVRQEVVRGVMLGREAQIDTEKLSGRLKRNIETEVRTGEMAFSRTVSNTKAEELGFTKYEYVGPLDQFNRPFCRERAGKVFSSDEIGNMKNGQGLDVFQFGGGYNCRHFWLPVKDDNGD